MLQEVLREWAPYRGRICGGIIGFSFGWLVIRYGIIQGLFVALCVGLGVYVGWKLDAGSPGGDWVDRLLR